MTVETAPAMRASRFRVARSRGAASGVLLLVLGAWAALVPMFGPYLDLKYTPMPNSTWHWTAARGWLEVLPGAVVFVAGVLLMISASRVMTSFAAWLAAAGGAWLVVGPSFAGPLGIGLGIPNPASSSTMRAWDAVLFFYGVGVLTAFVAGLALGRLTITSMRDMQAAERRLAAEEAAAATDYPAHDGSGRHQQPETSPVADGRPDVEQPTRTDEPSYASMAPRRIG
jgi:hypothetical protein